jgi:hypothetical protein
VFVVVSRTQTRLRWDEAADEAPLTVKGSMGQVVISPVRRNRKQEPERPAFTVADYYRYRLTTPNNTTPASHEDYLDYLRRAEISDRQS